MPTLDAAQPPDPPAVPAWMDRGQWRLRWQKFWQEVRRQKKWWLRRHTPYQPVFVLATPRSGSNLLLDCLRQLPGVQSQTEVLCPLGPHGPMRERLSPRQAIRHVRYSLQTMPAPIRGCKLMLHQLASSHVTMADLDEAFPTAKYIVIYRQSLADQFVSQKLAETTQQWLLAPGERQREAQVVIEPSQLRSYCEQMRAGYRALLSHPGLTAKSVIVSYEELAADAAACLREMICPLLGLPPQGANARTRKQNTKGPAERVANYAEVAGLLASPMCRQRHAWTAPPAALRRAA